VEADMAGAVEIRDHLTGVRMIVNADGSLGIKNAIGDVLNIAGTIVSTPSGVQSVSITTPVTFPVTGTVTTVPSGTQTVSGTVTALPSGTQAVSGTVSAIPIKDPAITGTYMFNLDSIAGVAGANNYMSLYNPLASGKTLILFGVFISCGAAASSTIVVPIRGIRANTIAAGTLQASSAIAKFSNAYANTVAEVRTGGPTAVLDGAMFASPPANNTNNLVVPVHAVTFPAGTGPFLLAAGEGMVLNASSGDVDLRWNLGMIWGEM